MTRIVELLPGWPRHDGPTVSLEFSPPRSEDDRANLFSVVEELSVLGPSFASVTYGALGSTRDVTRDAVIELNARHRFPTMAHLTCVGHTKAEVVDLLDAYAAGGVENILALGGDPPENQPAGGDFTYALELVELVRDHPGNFSVGVAAHPEKHPRSESLVTDRRHLAEKLSKADFGITQFGWTVEPYVEMVNDLVDLGCETPVIPGVMLFINVHSMRRMAGLNDAVVPPELWERCEAADGDPRAVRILGTDLCEEVSRGLLDAGAPGLHLYTMNRAPAALDLVTRLGLRRD